MKLETKKGVTIVTLEKEEKKALRIVLQKLCSGVSYRQLEFSEKAKLLELAFATI